MLTLCEIRVDFKAVYFLIGSGRVHKEPFDLISVGFVWLEHETSLYEHGSSLIAKETEREIIIGC